MRKQFYAQFVQPGDLCFDVGANVGNRIDPILQIGAKVVAVEPQKQCYEILQRKFGDKIAIVKKGLSDEEGVKEFFISDESTISSFSKEWIDKVKEGRFKYYSWNKTEKIEMTTLDRLIEQYGLPVFIKIDVEGYELEVLKGLSKKVKFISFEYTVPEQTNKAMACLEKLLLINPSLKCNYSVGESMQLENKEWMDGVKMLEHISSPAFTATEFGDIYVMN
jgi:FkbM family methyltransferase